MADAALCPYCGGSSGFSFDRSLCACGSMHDYCEDCGNALDCPLDAPKVAHVPAAAKRWDVRVDDDVIDADSPALARAEFIRALNDDPSLIYVRAHREDGYGTD